jgi:hypothetical protein
MVKGIEEFSPELQSPALCDSKVLVNRKIEVVICRPCDDPYT